jgi:hypothetical protein
VQIEGAEEAQLARQAKDQTERESVSADCARLNKRLSGCVNDAERDVVRAEIRERIASSSFGRPMEQRTSWPAEIPHESLRSLRGDGEWRARTPRGPRHARRSGARRVRRTRRVGASARASPGDTDGGESPSDPPNVAAKAPKKSGAS